MKIAIIPVGYNNGIGFGINSHYVMINGNRYYVAGQVSMNMMAIIIDDNVNINDKVEIINEELSPKTLASFTNKLTIEILLMTGKSNRKVYIKNNKIVKEIRP
jgi:alanine racemase